MSASATLNDWHQWQVAQSLSARTMDDRERVMQHMFDTTGCHPIHFTADDVVEYISRPGISTSSRASYHATIRAYCKWLVKTGKRYDDPTTLTVRPKRPKNLPRPISDAQLEAMLNAANRRRARMMILLAAYQGLRVHEIAKFRGADIDHFSKSLTVFGKGGKTATIALHPAVAEESAGFPRLGYWFPSYKATGATLPHVTTAAVYFALKHAMQRAGFEGTPHQLRHWYGTTLLTNGVDVMIVKDMMRHESVATTQIYTKITLRQQQTGILVLPKPVDLGPPAELLEFPTAA